LQLLEEVEATARPVDAITSAFFRAHRGLEEADRGAILDRLYALMRHRARLGWWLARLGQGDSPRARLLAWLTLGERMAPDQIRRLWPDAVPLTGLPGGAMDHPDMPESLCLECPPWAEGPLRQRFGADFAAEMAATLLPPPLDLRVNPVQTTRAEALRDLQRLGLQARPTPFAPHGLRLPDRLSLSRLPGLRTGELEIQDEGSQLVAHLVDAQPGERVVDFCAGAGGKTLALAAQMQNRGHVVACDVNETRLKRCAERLRRAGLHNAETRVLTSESDRWVKRHRGSFDRVLIDAPCTGTGTWRRNPDARWRAPDLGLSALVALQARILSSAARLVRPGGRLVYATCSLLPQENEDQVAGFLATHPDFALVPLQAVAPQVTASAHPQHLSLTPLRHGTDGFFAAVLRRTR
jgi:16S rRNA (cytosine967-C5)-methyltransferase